MCLGESRVEVGQMYLFKEKQSGDALSSLSKEVKTKAYVTCGNPLVPFTHNAHRTPLGRSPREDYCCLNINAFQTVWVTISRII